MRKSVGLMTLLLVTLLATACGRAQAPPPAAGLKIPTVTAPQIADWERKWESAVAEAKKEGKVIVYAGWIPEVRTALGAAFKNKYGIEVEFFPLGRGAELLAKVQAERRAGLVVADVLSSGATTIITGLKPGGLLGPFESTLLLPEIKNPQMWRGGQVPFVDKDHMGLNMVAALQRMVVRNTDVVKENEITTHKDLLKPQFKGKMTLNDPTVTGVGNSLFTHFVVDLWGLEEASEFFRQLLKQEPVIVRDNRLHVESVARGKYAVGLGTLADMLANFLAVGAPIAPVITKEGTRVSSGTYSLSIPATSSHPQATIVFVNWLLSQEGQTVISKISHLPSMRVDVPTEGINPIYLPLPGEKLYPDTEEWQLTAVKMVDVAKRIIEETK